MDHPLWELLMDRSATPSELWHQSKPDTGAEEQPVMVPAGEPLEPDDLHPELQEMLNDANAEGIGGC